MQHKTLKNAVVADMEEHGYRHPHDKIFDLQVDKVLHYLIVLLLS